MLDVARDLGPLVLTHLGIKRRHKGPSVFAKLQAAYEAVLAKRKKK